MSVLSMEGIRKVFPGVVANDEVTFAVEAGEIHALVGENGAGKTTLMRILYGLLRPDSGVIRLDDTPAQIRGPRDAIRRGIGMVHQHFMLVPPFTVLENIILGEETHTAGVLALAEPARKIRELMTANGLEVDLDTRVEDLPVGLQQRVEILKILYRGARVLIFDEPTAVLTPQETQHLFKTFRDMTRDGKGIVFISHKLDEVLEIADRITVIRRGRVVRTLSRGEATKPLIAELMVGKPVFLRVEKPPPDPGETVLEVQDLRVPADHGAAALQSVSLRVRAGEIYGIAGVEGNGQSTLVRSIAEKYPATTGRILLRGQDIQAWAVRERREAGITHVPEDRHRYGLLLPFAVSDNCVLGRHHMRPYVGALQWVNGHAIRERAERVVREYDVRTPTVATPASALSGGNQQKLILAREISAKPVLLLASQPTRGVDVGATEFIYQQLVQARVQGSAVLLVSADLDEILALSDRIGVMYRGRIVKEFEGGTATKEEVGLAMMGEEARG